MLASLDGELAHLLMAQALETRPQDVAFEYKQGFRLVNGLHRAYYMEAMVNARQRAWGTAHDSLLMPIDITNRGADGRRYSVYLDNIRFYTFKATLDAYIIIETPFDGQKLVFEALGVEFTPKGPVINPIKIQLADDITVRLNNSARLKLIAGPGTYAAFDCLGFTGLGIEADIEICRAVIVPYDPPTDEILPDPKRVSGHFQIYLPTFSQFFVQFSMDPFVIPQYEDVKWIISGVALDMSETVSPTGAPPAGYLTPFANQYGFQPMWKGFYIDSLMVRLPKSFSSDSTPVTVSVQNLVIDNMGVSGSVTASDILSLNVGNAGGWAFAIDDFELTVLMNQFSRAQFTGKVHVPIFRAGANNSGTLTPEDCIAYTARIDPGNLYSFELSSFTSGYAVDIWKAGEVQLSPASSISMHYHNGDFSTLANLSGVALVDGELLPNVEVEIPAIKFEGVEVSNKTPYFSPGHWDFPNQVGAKFAGFELTFQNIGMVADTANNPALKFNVYVHITDDTTKLKANGGFRIIGELNDDNGRQRWKYKDFSVDELHIAGSFPGIRRLEGYAAFYENDATYGTGFRGGLAAEFDLVDASIEVVGQFGRMPAGYKYFLVDALYCGDIPMAGAFSLKGIGGGVYYHMNRPDGLYGLPVCSGSVSIPPQTGASLSGIVYTPDESKGIGFKLTVAIGLASAERAFNANATYEVLFHDGGGIDRMWMYGNAKLMSDLDLSGLPTFVQGVAPNNDAMIGANFRLDVEFGPSGKIDGQLEVFANVAGILRGSAPGDKVVDAHIFIAPGKWFIKIGSPGNRTGLDLTIPGFGTLAKVQSYFQIGTDIDDIPPLPDDIARLTGAGQVSPGTRDLSVTAGKGFSFGSDIRLGSKEYKFLIFYAGLQLNTGFDVSVLDYGPDVICAGETEPIGINGWYAKGQIYAGLFGSLGIRVKIFGSTKQFKILELAAAAAMEARLPNPFWARASFGFEYNILNGLVSGQGDFQVEIGEQCLIMGEDPFKDVPVILSTNPSPGHKNVSVSIEPAVSFNFPIGETFKFEDLNGNATDYKITFDSAKLLWRGYEIYTEKRWQTPRYLVLRPNTFLPGNDTLTLVVKVHVDSSGVTVDNEERVVVFTTGSGLDHVPAYNVAGSYPLDGQYNFYKDQIADYKGYIQLKKGQPDLFFEKENYIKVIRFRQSGGACTFQTVEFSSENYWEKRIEFDIPATFLQNEQAYEIQLLDFPKADPNWGAGFAGAAPCLCENCGTPPPGGNGAQQIRHGDNLPAPPAPPAVPAEKVLYSAYFRVSEYDTFMEKLEALATAQEYAGTGTGAKGGPEQTALLRTGPADVIDFSVNTNIEPFDQYEINGGVALEAMIVQPQEGLEKTWFVRMPSNFVFGYFPDPATGIGKDYPLGLPELVKAVKITGNGAAPKVTKQNYLNGSFPATYGNLAQKIYFYAPKVAADYFNKLQTDAYSYMYANRNVILGYYECPSDFAVPFCLELHCDSPGLYSKGFKRLVSDCDQSALNFEPTYPVLFRYNMPGWNQVTTTHYINLVGP